MESEGNMKKFIVFSFTFVLLFVLASSVQAQGPFRRAGVQTPPPPPPANVREVPPPQGNNYVPPPQRYEPPRYNPPRYNPPPRVTYNYYPRYNGGYYNGGGYYYDRPRVNLYFNGNHVGGNFSIGGFHIGF